MSIFTMLPVVRESDLARAVNEKFGTDIIELAPILFGDDFSNDSYKSYCFDDECGDEEREVKCINAYLREALPDYNTVLVDVSW